MANLDPDVLNLAKAIRQVETGNRPVKGASGELASRYQYMPATWKATAKKYLGDENAPLTLENENKATYLKIKDWKDSGLGPDQIASMWNSGSPDWKGKVGVNKSGVKYDVPGYVQKVGSEYQKLKSTAQAAGPTSFTPQIAPPSQISASGQADLQTAEKYGAFFTPNTTNPGLVSESLKTVGNIIPSAWNFVKGAIDLVNPLSTIEKLKSIPGEVVGLAKDVQSANQSGANLDAGKLLAGELGRASYEVIPEGARALGEAGYGYATGDTAGADARLQQAQRAIVSDPVGQIAPFLIGGRAAAEKLGAGAKFDSAVSRVASPVTKVAESIKRSTGNTTKFGVGQATGLQPDTISQILKKPEEFSKRSQATVDRLSLGREIQSALNKRATTLSETGALYDPIRAAETTIKVSKNWLKDTIKEETGLTFKNGKFQGSANAKLRDSGDIRAIQQVFDNYQPVFKKGEMTPNEFLNLRTDLAKAAKFEKEIGTRSEVQKTSGFIRAKLNEAYRKEIDGLKKLDEEYKPQRGELKELSKGLVDRNGNLSDTALNRIANATGKGKDQLLARLEEASPGITQKIKVLKAVEDIQHASGIKVGTYGRTGLAVLSGVTGGVIQAIITYILTSPEIAVPLLRSLGLLKNSAAIEAILNVLKGVNEIPESIQAAGPVSLNDALKKLKQPSSTVFGKK